MAEEIRENSNFIHDFIDKDLEDGVYSSIQTRFPPEPNGYLHIGHAKAICINFGVKEKYKGVCNLRLDDTNPTKEDTEYVDAIKEDIQWLGFQWDNLYYASDYFDFLFDCAIKLIKKGKAFVCELTPEEMRAYRGTLTEPGKESPYRNRSVEENLDLFMRMSKGEFPEGSKVLRAKIDMSSPNLNMRDPIIYRIMYAHHHRTGDKWCVYPMYDFAHPLSDAAEKVTYSLCSLEFENHRPLYNWFVDAIGFEEPPRQIEFARLNLNYCVTSKRKCLEMVQNGVVNGWDDPRMPTICGLRRRGYTPASIRNFSVRNGVSKVNSTVEYSFLEHCLREDLNLTAKRVMGVLNPVKLILTNYPEDRTETFEVENNPNRPEDGTRTVTFGRELYIEAEDFMETPVKGYFRLFPGNEVRLKTTYVVKCTGCKKDENGNVVEVYAEYDPESRGGNPADGRKIKSTIHWVDAKNAEDAEIRLYDNLFTVEDPDAGDFLELLNPDSLKVLTGCKVEAGLKTAKPGESFQFMRQGYFCVDNKDSAEDHLVFNRSVSLKDGFKKKK